MQTALEDDCIGVTLAVTILSLIHVIATTPIAEVCNVTVTPHHDLRLFGPRQKLAMIFQHF
jgi:hypothetical protein